MFLGSAQLVDVHGVGLLSYQHLVDGEMEKLSLIQNTIVSTYVYSLCWIYELAYLSSMFIFNIRP